MTAHSMLRAVCAVFGHDYRRCGIVTDREYKSHTLMRCRRCRKERIPAFEAGERALAELDAICTPEDAQ